MSWFTMVSHGLPRYALAYRRMPGHHGITWCTMVCRGSDPGHGHGHTAVELAMPCATAALHSQDQCMQNANCVFAWVLHVCPDHIQAICFNFLLHEVPLGRECPAVKKQPLAEQFSDFDIRFCGPVGSQTAWVRVWLTPQCLGSPPMTGQTPNDWAGTQMIGQAPQ